MTNRVTRSLLVASLCVVLWSLAGGSVHAQKKSGGVIRLEVTTIEGRVQKPNAFFINTRQGLVYETMEIRESFIDQIPKVVEDGDF